MNSITRLAFPSLFTAFFLVSCGPSLTDITTSLIEQGRNDEALARMRRAVVLEPNEAEYHRLMGIALYNKKQYAEAIKTFDKVLKMDDEDDQAAYYLAASYEASKDYNKAIQNYRLYNELTFFGEYRELVESRIKLLYRQQMEIEAQRALQMEKQLDVSKIPSNTVAILYFENKGQKAELNPLQKGLAEMIITDLSKVRSLKVIERIRLQQLIQEMNLGETDLVDQKTAPRLGNLLGAYRLVKGSYFELKDDKVNIDAFVAQTKTGQLDVTTNISGNIKDFFRLEKDLVFKLIEEMKIKLTDEEREAILEIPTENFFAFLQYSRGLDYEDRGMYTQAYEAYSQAAITDPNFSQAKTSASSAKKSEQIVGPTTEQSGSQQQSENNQQPNTVSTSSTSTSSSPLSLSPPTLVPSSNPINRPGGGSIGDRLNNLIGNINNNLNPGTGNQNQPPPVISRPLPEPPKPPVN
ncbi:MAG: tetratricopeptide repeat protein [Ignavibacteriales bacterium]|nr:tetratricopeptide repeat protein [Ignavibacteriales bacterium]